MSAALLFDEVGQVCAQILQLVLGVWGKWAFTTYSFGLSRTKHLEITFTKRNG